MLINDLLNEPAPVNKFLHGLTGAVLFEVHLCLLCKFQVYFCFNLELFLISVVCLS